MIAAADVVVGRAGYNTVCEILGAGTPAVLVPRVFHRGEQLLRANRLAARGLVQVLPEDQLTSDALVTNVRWALRRGRQDVRDVQLDGAEAASSQVSRLLPAADHIRVG